MHEHDEICTEKGGTHLSFDIGHNVIFDVTLQGLDVFFCAHFNIHRL